MIKNKTINALKLSVYSFFIFIYFCEFLKKVDRIVDITYSSKKKVPLKSESVGNSERFTGSPKPSISLIAFKITSSDTLRLSICPPTASP